MTLPPALLLGGEHMAVSAARSIAALGAEIHAAGDRADPLRRSRVCSSFTEVPAGPGLADRYLEFLERGPRGAVLIPCDDAGMEMLARHRATIEGWGYRGIEANDEIVLAMLDKERTYELARRAGVPTPRTTTVRTVEEARDAAGSFPYPCAMKPLSSHRYAEVMPTGPKVFVANGPDDLVDFISLTADADIAMLVTEIVPGPDENFVSYYSYLLPDGTPHFHYTKHKLRQLPIDFGYTCYQESVWEPQVAELGLRFFQSSGLRGVGNVEFKRDEHTGEWKLIECNHRFTLANEIVRLSGIDIPAIAYSRVAGLPLEPIRGYRLRVRMWNPIEDANAMLHYREAGRLTFRAWVRSLMCRWHFPMWRVRDPMPTVHAVATRVPRLSRALVRRVGRWIRPTT